MIWTCLLFIRSGQNHVIMHMKGGRRPGRQKKRWDDNIGEWTGVELTKSQRAVKNREKWRELIVKSLVVPQQPSPLRER